MIVKPSSALLLERVSKAGYFLFNKRSCATKSNIVALLSVARVVD